MLDLVHLAFAVFTAAWVSRFTLVKPMFEVLALHDDPGRKSKSKFRLPGWCYWHVWLLMDALIIAAEILHEVSSGTPDAAYEVVVALFFFNVAMRDLWRVVYFKFRMWPHGLGAALVLSMLCVGSTIPVLIYYFAAADAGDWTLWISFAFYVVYAIWLTLGVFAVTAVHIARGSKKAKEEKEKEKKGVTSC